jgi:hypothetical protein
MGQATLARPFNGKTGEFVRWTAAMVISAVVAYFSAQMTIEKRLSTVEARQQANFDELMRVVSDIKFDVRELRNRKD